MTLEHGEVRGKLVAAALDLMASGGIEAVKARVLAETVGVSVGSIYNLFGNVDGVIEHACAEVFDQLNALGHAQTARLDADFAEAVGQGQFAEDGKDQLRFALLSLATLYVGFVTENEKSWEALLAFNRGRAVGDAAEWYLAKQAELIGLVSDRLDGAPGMAAAGRRETTAWALWSAVHGIVTLSYVGQVRPDTLARTNAQIETLIGLLVAGIYAA